jgi:hypothetical protein
VIFERPAPQIAIAAQDPPAGSVDVPRSTDIGAWFTEGVRPGGTLAVTAGGDTITGTTTLSSDATRLTFKPSSALPQNATVTITLSGVVSTGGAALGTKTWSFRTAATQATAVPQSLFSDQVPATTAATEASAVELGTAFTPTKDGTITAIRFYKGTGNAGTHVGRVWSFTGQQLASVTFTGETPTGWQSAQLTQPLAVTAGTTYVVSYLAPQGHYSHTAGFFTSPLTNGDLTAPAGKNGRYLYGAAGGFPVYDHQSTSYFVDVSFVAAQPTITLTGRSPAPGVTDVSRSSAVTATLSAPISAGYSLVATQGSTTIAGTTSLSADKTTVTFRPSAAWAADTDITITLSGIVSTDGATLGTQGWTFHTETTSTTISTLFGDQTPTTAAINDSNAVEVGTAFTPSTAGTVTGIRFYKGTGNTGTHVGTLWSSLGATLGTVTFSGESATGWQTASFATPIPVTAGTTYVVSYLAPQGRYSGTPGFFGSAYTAGPLTARAGNNGLYLYGASGGFPTQSYNATSYFVDVLFRGAS